jgi:hypothetical protein
MRASAPRGSLGPPQERPEDAVPSERHRRAQERPDAVPSETHRRARGPTKATPIRKAVWWKPAAAEEAATERRASARVPEMQRPASEAAASQALEVPARPASA